MHVPTGLFALRQLRLSAESTRVSGRVSIETWYGKLGLRSRFSALGHTVFYGEYLNADGSWLDYD